jgi:hypothetical protein
MDVCVCLSGADARVVEGRATSHGCCVVFVLCRPERRKEKRGWAWVAGESTPEPRRIT